MKHLNIILIILTVLTFFACREDRTGEYEALIAQDVWIKEQMNNLYLWREDIPADSKLNFFHEPEIFFKSLLSAKCQNGKGDKYSYLETLKSTTKSIQEETTYGFDFFLFQPSQTPKQLVARIIYVLKESPAEKAGLKRGDWIAGINGNELTNNNYRLLYNGEAISVIRAKADTTSNIAQWTNTDTLHIEASQPIENNPFLVDTIYQYGSKRIGYLVYNAFRTGPKNEPSDETYNQQMRQYFAKYENQQITDFILDLRYNSGGYLSCAQVLASLLASTEAMGKPFCHLSFNELNSEKDTTYTLRADLTEGYNLNLKKIHIITSDRTASASEALINGLRPHMDIQLIGTTTEGKNVASLPIYSDKYPDITLHPIVAQVTNGTDENDYSKGLKPDYECNEKEEATFADAVYELGDTRETLLQHTLAIITGQPLPASAANRKRLSLSPIRSISGQKNMLLINN